MKIEKNTRIGELLEIDPDKAEILLNAGMHCLGCPASQAETIEEACEVKRKHDRRWVRRKRITHMFRKKQ